MQKGFTLKSFIIVIAVLIIMVLIAFFVQRKNRVDLDENSFDEDPDAVYDLQDQEWYEDDSDEEEKPEINDNQESTDDQQAEPQTDSPVVTKVKNDLTTKINVNYNDIKLIEFKETTFSDHTLGTSSPGQVVNQVLTKGYIIVLSANNRNYIYHATDSIFIPVY